MPGTKRKRLDWHPEAIAELAESLAWYAKRNPTAAKRMRKVIEDAAHSLIASPIAVSGRLGVVAGTRELPVGQGRLDSMLFERTALSRKPDELSEQLIVKLAIDDKVEQFK